jgi:hypothetical protein
MNRDREDIATLVEERLGLAVPDTRQDDDAAFQPVATFTFVEDVIWPRMGRAVSYPRLPFPVPGASMMPPRAPTLTQTLRCPRRCIRNWLRAERTAPGAQPFR